MNLSIEIKMFCTKFDVNLIDIAMTEESGFKEPMYFFNDNLGGYSLHAIRCSICDNSENYQLS